MWFPLTKEQLTNETVGEYSLSKVIFGENGKAYPRMVVALYPSVHPCGGIEIGCSLKREMDGWWEECGMPDDVVKQLSAMLASYSSKEKGYDPKPEMTGKELEEINKKIATRAKQIIEKDKCSVRYAVFAAEEEAKTDDGEKSFDDLIKEIRYGTGDSWFEMKRS